eukprot:GHVQ01017770.1.p1 GENE.GHVQ01017770.1~~GHVQ01017770.1.p1  ORF type:complete len:146 (+),score=15.29 GHVQ01017770.1:206-643(+)
MSLCCDNDAGTSSTGEEFSSLADCSEDVDQCTLTGAERCSSRTPMTVRTSEKHCLALKDKEQVLKEGTDAVKSWRCAYRMMNTPVRLPNGTPHVVFHTSSDSSELTTTHGCNPTATEYTQNVFHEWRVAMNAYCAINRILTVAAF